MTDVAKAQLAMNRLNKSLLRRNFAADELKRKPKDKALRLAWELAELDVRAATIRLEALPGIPSINPKEKSHA